MDNSLAKYLDKELKDVISSLTVAQGIAKDSGNPYYYIDLAFINGYKKRIFLRTDEQFAWTNAFDLLDMQDTVDSTF